MFDKACNEIFPELYPILQFFIQATFIELIFENVVSQFAWRFAFELVAIGDNGTERTSHSTCVQKSRG